MGSNSHGLDDDEQRWSVWISSEFWQVYVHPNFWYGHEIRLDSLGGVELAVEVDSIEFEVVERVRGVPVDDELGLEDKGDELVDR